MKLLQVVLWLCIGGVLAVAFIAIARRTGSAERLVLAVGIAAATLVYAGYAAVNASASWVGVELLGTAAYGLTGWLGMRGSMWWLVAGWLLHPVWDAGLHLAGAGAAFAPAWYAINCISFDLLVAAYVARSTLLDRRKKE